MTASYNPDDFARLRPAEDVHFWFVARNNVLATVLASLAADVPPTGTALEIGCGTGNTLRVIRQAFPSATLVGMDLFHDGLIHARERTTAMLVQGRVEEMPFARPFALIAMFDVLEHIDDDLTALRVVRRLLEPSGTLILTVPASPSLWSRFDEESQHKRRYTASVLRTALTDAQFHVEYLTHFMSVTYPVAWIWRRLDRLASRLRNSSNPPVEPALVRELNVSRSTNAVLAQVLGLEIPLIRGRFHLPLGGSLLAVARA